MQTLSERLPLATWIGSAVVLVVAVFPLPYGYYTFTRIVVCLASGTLALTLLHEKASNAKLGRRFCGNCNSVQSYYPDLPKAADLVLDRPRSSNNHSGAYGFGAWTKALKHQTILRSKFQLTSNRGYSHRRTCIRKDFAVIP
jgi:hypothetical protein